MSKPDNLSFLPMIPPHLYRKYFDIMRKDQVVYVCVVQNEAQLNAIFLESPSEAEKHLNGKIRVFLDIEDVKAYCRTVSVTEGIPPESLRRWEMKFSALMEYVAAVDKKSRDAEKGGVNAVASMVQDNKFLDMDLIWTSEPGFVV